MATCFQHAAVNTWLESSQSWTAKAKTRGKNERKKKIKHVSMSICRELENMNSERREAAETQMRAFLRELSELKQASPCYSCLYLRGPKWCVKPSISFPTLFVITLPTPSPTLTIWERIIWVWQKMQKQFIFPRLWKTAIKTIPDTLKIN